jgi:hypothetical protein
MRQAHHYHEKGRLPKGVLVGQYTLYNIADVRDWMWRRSDRKLSKQRAPYLLEELIQFFLSYKAEYENAVPSDAAFATDDKFQAKFERLLKLPSPARETAMRELWAKVELAKSVAGT